MEHITYHTSFMLLKISLKEHIQTFLNSLLLSNSMILTIGLGISCGINIILQQIYNLMHPQPNNPLHGITLKTILTALVERYGRA